MKFEKLGDGSEKETWGRKLGDGSE